MNLIIQKQLGSLEISRGNPNVVFLSRMIELGKTPVNEPHLKQS